MRFLICVALAALIGFGTAWSINQNRYGYRDAMFGPFDTANTVSVANVEDHVVLTPTDPGSQPTIELIGESRHDFGVMAPGAEGQHSFRIKNSGNKELNLRIGASTCKCTVGDLDKSVLEPGEETDVTLTWTVKEGVREFTQSAQLITTDPKRPALTLEIAGLVVGDFEFLPEVWTFNEVASSETFEITGEIYNYTDAKIELGQPRFTSEKLTELSEFEIERVPEEEFCKVREDAKECFRVTAKVKPGMRQGAISQNMLVPFTKSADRPNENESPTDAVADAGMQTPDDVGAIKNENANLVIPTRGRVVGMISMIESTKLQGNPGGGYRYEFGRVSRGDSLTAKTFVVLKGSQRENTKLTVGEVTPAGVVDATLDEPKSRGSMVLYPLTLRLKPGKESIERLGKNKDDYGKVWIESDNPQVPKMGILLTFAIEAQ